MKWLWRCASSKPKSYFHFIPTAQGKHINALKKWLRIILYCTTHAQLKLELHRLMSSGTLLRALTVNRLGFLKIEQLLKRSHCPVQTQAYREAKISQVVSEPNGAGRSSHWELRTSLYLTPRHCGLPHSTEPVSVSCSRAELHYSFCFLAALCLRTSRGMRQWNTVFIWNLRTLT